MKTTSQVVRSNLFRAAFIASLSLHTLTSASLASAETDTSWIVNSPEVLAEAKQLTKTLNRTITVYSWVAQGNIEGLPATGLIDSLNPTVQQAAMKNAADRMSRFWDLTVPVSGRSATGGAMAPNGLYVATEPVISRTYGGKTPVVYQMQLPQGMTFIDGRYQGNPVVGPNLKKALADRGCTDPLAKVPNEGKGFTARSLIKSDTHQKECRQALMDIAAALDVKAVIYIFKSEPVPACKNVFEWNSAFVLIKPEAVLPGSFFPIGKEVPAQPDALTPSRQLINAAFQNASLPAEFSGVAPLDTNTAVKMMSENFFACKHELRKTEVGW